MYTPPPPSAASATAKRSLLPLAALCCLGILGFLIAVTIILALIPVYLPRKDLQTSSTSNSDTFYLNYVANGDSTSSFTGTLANPGEVGQKLNGALGTNNAIQVVSGKLQTAFVRRRRSLLFRHTKRSIKNKCLLTCTPRYKPECSAKTCRDAVKTKIRSACEKTKNIPDIPCQIRSKEFGLKSVSLSFTFVNLSSTIPLGFAGEPSTLGLFVAVASGEFNNPLTWADGIVPYGEASVVISAGISVTLSNALLDLNMKKCDVYGTLALGSSANAAFTFQFLTNIIVRAGGKLQDQTSGHQIFSPPGTLLTVHPGASFTGSNTVFIASTGARLILGSSFSGPFTCGILPGGVILSFKKVTYIVTQSSEFNIAATWLGGIVPTAEICASVGGCGLHVPQNYILSTASLNGQLNINFNLITVATGGSFILTAATVSSGFTFNFAVNLIVQSGSTLQTGANINQLYCLAGSLFTFHPGASFTGTNVVLSTYSSLPATGSIGKSVTLGSKLSGPFTVGVLLDGSIQTFTKVTFLAVVSGSFSDSTNWLGGIAPAVDVCTLVGGCGMYIAAGCTLSTVSLSGQLNINFNLITVANSGSFTIDAIDITTGFTFNFAVNLIVQSGGQLLVGTSVTQLYCLAGSLFTVHPGASFTGSNVVLSIYKSLPATGSIGKSVTVGSGYTGPFTLGVLLDGSIQTFTKVTFLAVVSGSFSDSTKWLGGIAPTVDVCTLVGGCGMYIAAGCTLSTVSLSGQLNINFNLITVANSGSFTIDAIDVTIGFTFNFAINIIVQSGGQLLVGKSVTQLYCLAGSLFTVYPGASFTGSNVVLSTYSSLPATGSIGKSVTVGSGYTGPFTLGVLLDGSIQTFTKVTFLAVVSGSFGASTSWLGGIVPTADICALVGGCGMYISSGCILSTASLNGQLNINVNLITIVGGGSFELSATTVNIGFTFNFAVNFIVKSGGKLLAGTGVSQVYCLAGSLFTVHPGASFTGSNVVLSTYKSLPATGSIITSVTVGSGYTGPFTLGILLDGSIQTFTKVTFLALVSGSFGASTSWLGGIVPTADICALVGGCGMYISSGCTLSTASLNGELNINFNAINVAVGGIFQLGAVGASTGFKFRFSLILDCFGQVQTVVAGLKFYLPFGCVFNIYSGGSLLSQGTSFLNVFNALTDLTVGSPLPFTGLFIGPYFITISLTGVISISTTVPGTLPSGITTTTAAVTTTTTPSNQILVFITAQSGAFDSPATWVGGVVPNGQCSITINAGIVVTFTGPTLLVNVRTFNIFGTFIVVSSGNVGFTFSFAVNVIVYSTGKLQDQTNNGRLYCLAGSLLTFYTGASFTGSSSQIFTYTTIPATASAGASFTLGSSLSGPFTLGILLDRTIQTFTKVTFIAIQSGSFSTDISWLGGISPTVAVCNLVSGCGLYISSGCTLSTAGLNGRLNINFNLITVATGGSFAIDVIDITAGFTFNFMVNIIVRSGGTILAGTSVSRLYCLAGSLVTFHNGGSFTGSNVLLFTYKSLPATGSAGVSVILGSKLSGPFTAGILLDGTIQTFTKVTFLAVVSGSFSDSASWLGGIVPGADICALVGGCGMYISSGCTLSTATLNGELNINFNLITIVSGGVFQLGANGINSGFKFRFSLVLNCYGLLEDVTGGNNGIYVVVNSGFTFFLGGSFRSKIRTFIYVYNLLTGALIGLSFGIGILLQGPYYILISLLGVLTFGIGLPGQSTDSPLLLASTFPSSTNILF